MTVKNTVADDVRKDVDDATIGRLYGVFHDLVRRLKENVFEKAIDPERVKWFLQRASEGPEQSYRSGSGRNLYFLECRRNDNLFIAEYYPVVLAASQWKRGFEHYFESTTSDVSRELLRNEIERVFKSIPSHDALTMQSLSRVTGSNGRGIRSESKTADLCFSLRPIMKFDLDGRPVSLMPKPKIRVICVAGSFEAHYEAASIWTRELTANAALDSLFALLRRMGEPYFLEEYEIIRKY